jgi:hypothetical protein
MQREMHRLAKLEYYTCHPDHDNDTSRVLQWGYYISEPRKNQSHQRSTKHESVIFGTRASSEQDLENARGFLKDNVVMRDVR